MIFRATGQQPEANSSLSPIIQAPSHPSNMNRTESSKSIFSVLPVELLAIIKSNIPQEDLRTNVCFYNTCHCFASLFGSETAQKPFWEGSCLLAGIGLFSDESPRTVSWKSIAFDIIEQDGFCDHPECGGTRLDSNGTHSLVILGHTYRRIYSS